MASHPYNEILYASSHHYLYVCVVRYEDEFVVGRAESFSVDVKPPPMEEENQHLREAVSALRAAVRTERGRREGVERECNLLIAEFSRLQTRVQVRSRMEHSITALGLYV